MVKAERCYYESIKHAERTGDKWLLGRSLHNLAMMIMDRDYDKAIQFIKKSLAVKKSGGDQIGILGGYMGYGNLAAQKREFIQAVRWYRKAEKKARSYGVQHLLSLALNNIGCAYTDLGRFREALAYFREAHGIAEREGYPDVLILTVQGEAIARFRRRKFGHAEELFRKLFDLRKNLRDSNGMIVALYNVGVALMKQDKGLEARQVLARALNLAKRAEDDEWTYQCQVVSAYSYAENGNMRQEIRSLRKVANAEQKAGLYTVAARLWEAYANCLIDRGESTNEIEKAFQRCIQCLNQATNAHQHRLRVYKQLYIWRWENRHFEPAIEMLDEIGKLAVSMHEPKERIQAIDQKGVCLQQVEQFENAEKAHRRALKLARDFKDKECIETSLNNLGELLRKTERFEEAVKMFIEAENLARSRDDTESEVSVTHNRALALEDLGRSEETEKLLRSCRDISKSHKLWYEYVRALHGLGNVAWMQDKYFLAKRRYVKALAEAENRKLLDMRCGIALNYSRLLRDQRQFAVGIRILELLENKFAGLPDSYLYYMTLADLCYEVNDIEAAEVNWKKANQAASHARKEDIAAKCSAALAEIRQKENKPKLTDTELRDLFDKEDDPEKKTSILLQRIDILLDRKNEKKAEKLFGQARTIIQEHNLKKLYVDLHMKVGDYNWDQGLRSQYSAMQAYIAAMIKAIEIDINASVKVALHIFDRIITIEGNKRITRINALCERISRWLSKEMGETGADLDLIVKWALWPLRLARQLSLASQGRYPLPKKAINKIIDKEVRNLRL